MASTTSLTLPWAHPWGLWSGSLSTGTWTQLPRAPLGVALCWLAAWTVLSPPPFPFQRPLPCSAAAYEPSVLEVIESSCSCWAEVRVLQSAPQPWTEHTGIPTTTHLIPPQPGQKLSLSSSPGPNKPGSSLSFSLFHLSISWHAVTPLIGIINQTGQIRLQIKINFPEHPPLRHLHFCSKASLLTGLLPPHLLNKSKMSTAGSRLKTRTLWQTVGVHYCFIDINNSPYLQRWWLLRTNLPSM